MSGSQASPIVSPSVSSCVKFETKMQLSHASPTPSESTSDWLAFGTDGQLSVRFCTPSPSSSAGIAHGELFGRVTPALFVPSVDSLQVSTRVTR